VRPDWQGCVLADIRMPGMSGLDMQRALAERHAALPVIIITGHGDIDAARQAFKAAASDFLEKPFDDERLVRAIEHALATAAGASRTTTDGARLPTLSTREREVRDLVVAGLDNGAIGASLGISPRTVEVHKARLMAKLGVRNLAELVRTSVARKGS
jgi:FixJ family two-component response regulator